MGHKNSSGTSRSLFGIPAGAAARLRLWIEERKWNQKNGVKDERAEREVEEEERKETYDGHEMKKGRGYSDLIRILSAGLS